MWEPSPSTVKVYVPLSMIEISVSERDDAESTLPPGPSNDQLMLGSNAESTSRNNVVGAEEMLSSNTSTSPSMFSPLVTTSPSVMVIGARLTSTSSDTVPDSALLLVTVTSTLYVPSSSESAGASKS